MKINCPALEAFVSVAELGSFTRAAQHIGLSQTALTHRIAKLERDLCAKLLQRSTRDVNVTPAPAMNDCRRPIAPLDPMAEPFFM